MGNQKPLDERTVYVALKSVFEGQNALVRQPSAIRKLIGQHKEQSLVAKLVNGYGLDTICIRARTLLIEEIFESPNKAQIRFPKIYSLSPRLKSKGQLSEGEAAERSTNTIQDAPKDGNSPQRPGEADTKRELDTLGSEEHHHAPLLFPAYLPVRTQHALLAMIQDILEKACFRFGHHHMPDVLENNRWACSEAAELHCWAAEFLQCQEAFADKAALCRRPLETLFRSVSDIRHAAVHRISVSAKGIEQFILDAESLAIILGDAISLEALGALRREVQSVSAELEGKKHVSSSKYNDTLQRIAASRAELDRQEEAATAAMIEEDKRYKANAGDSLERSVRRRELGFFRFLAAQVIG